MSPPPTPTGPPDFMTPPGSWPILRPFAVAAWLFALVIWVGGCGQLADRVSSIAEEVGFLQGGPPAKPATAPPTPVTPRSAAEASLPPTAAPPALPSQEAPVETMTLPSTAAPGEQVMLTRPPGVRKIKRVGLLVPLSGSSAPLGRALLNAAQLALFELARDDFVLVPRDTRGTREGAARAAEEVIEEGVGLILGPLFAPSVEAVAPAARAEGINVVAFSNDRSVAGDGVFIMGFMPEMLVARIVTYAHSRGISRFAALLPDTVYGTTVAEALRRVAAAIGATVYQVERYSAADAHTVSPVVRRLADYDARKAALTAQLQALEGKEDEASKRALKRLEKLETLGEVEFDAVLIPEGGAKIRAIAPLLPFYEIDTRKVRVLGTVEWDDPGLITEPALFGGWYSAPSPKGRESFEKGYAETYGQKPPRLASLAYDATALAAVLAQADWTERFSSEALTASNGFTGIDGIFRLLPSGLVERGLAVIEVRPRRTRIVSPAPQTFERLAY